MNKYDLSETAKNKIVSFDDLEKIISEYQSRGKSVVLTNGAFDVLHVNHIYYLQQASQFGDILICLINSDNSIKRLKGEDRPIFNECNRSYIISSFSFVDYVSIFNDTRLIGYFEKLHPNIWVKGEDYDLTKLNQIEKNEAYSMGVDIRFTKNNPIDDQTTTSIINKIYNRG